MPQIEKYDKNEILTHTGKIFDPWEIRKQDVDIRDIAHALSLITRANGHLKHFYSVAQHCVNCAIEAKNRGYSECVQLACLTHDAAECYIADVPRPVKHRLTGYAEVEDKVLDVVWEAFGLGDITNDELAQVFGIDDAILYYEFIALKQARIRQETPYISMEHDFGYRDMGEVEAQFLEMFEELLNDK